MTWALELSKPPCWAHGREEGELEERLSQASQGCEKDRNTQGSNGRQSGCVSVTPEPALGFSCSFSADVALSTCRVPHAVTGWTQQVVNRGSPSPHLGASVVGAGETVKSVQVQWSAPVEIRKQNTVVESDRRGGLDRTEP